MRSSADTASSVSSCRELGSSLLFIYHCFFCHIRSPYSALKGIPRALKSSLASSSVFAVVTKQIQAGEKGQIKIDFQMWPAVALKEKEYNVGEKVIIKEIVGNKFIIDDIEEIEIQ